MCVTALWFRCNMFLESVLPLQPREKKNYNLFPDNQIQEQQGMLRKKKKNIYPLGHEEFGSHECCLSCKMGKRPLSCSSSKKQIP